MPWEGEGSVKRCVALCVSSCVWLRSHDAISASSGSASLPLVSMVNTHLCVWDVVSCTWGSGTRATIKEGEQLGILPRAMKAGAGAGVGVGGAIDSELGVNIIWCLRPGVCPSSSLLLLCKSVSVAFLCEKALYKYN